MTFSQDERDALARLLAELGPTAPTLCTGWNTYDLAAHLVARERRPDSGPGLILSAFAGWTERVRLGVKQTPYEPLVGLVRSGPPRWSPFALPAIDEVTNLVEFFVHHEDIRRAQDGWQPRELPAELEETLSRRLRPAARRFFRHVPVGVVLRRPDGLTAAARSGTPAVTLVGPPAELTLYAFGRRDQAQVRIEGDPAAVESLVRAPVGL